MDRKQYAICEIRLTTTTTIFVRRVSGHVYGREYTVENVSL